MTSAGRSLTIDLVLHRAHDEFAAKKVWTRRSSGVRTRSYAEIVQRARLLGGVLSRLGVRPGDRVATFGHNSDVHLELQLGIPSAGAVVVPLNVRNSPEQLAWTLRDSGARFVFVDEELADAWRCPGPPTADLTTVMYGDETGEYEVLLAGATPRPMARLAEERALALCYTSGTTGRPKGVVYSHRMVVLHALAGLYADGLGLRERDVVLPVVPQFHALGWGLPFTAMLAGSGLALPGRGLGAPELADLVAASASTVGSGLPMVWQRLLDAVRDGLVGRDRLVSLERLYCGGASVTERFAEQARSAGLRVVAAWGMTETAPVATVAADRSTLAADRRGPAGRSLGFALPTVRTRVVTAEGDIAPRDGRTRGELQVCGPWIADSYYAPDAPDGRGGLEAFTVDEDGITWLRTGDIVVTDPDGYLHLVDRDKDMIRSGGEWISSLELERHLVDHPAVTAAAVVAVPDETWGERPAAFVVTREPGTTADRLIEHLRGRVPSWQVPRDVLFVDALPETAVGKTDKKALRSGDAPAGPAGRT